ncbi:MAG: cobaltochelatase subunit CobN, partial [Pseudomonadota bacterium]
NMGSYYGSSNDRYGKKLENINLFSKQLSGTDIALHSRSSNLYGMLSTDDPFEYFGSLSLAIRNLDGQSPEMVISNLRNPKRVKPEFADRFLAKELRTRNFHPRWITEMMEEGYSGAVEMSARIDNFWGWQVVDPNIVRDDQWQSFFEVYIEDKLNLDIQEFFETVNPNAQARMLERMLEAVRKDYWKADEETIKKMIERYVEIVEKFDHYVDNEKLREYVNLSASGFGMDMNLSAPEAASAPELASEAQSVEGQQLEKVETSEAEESPRDWLLIIAGLVMLLFLVAGMFRQWFLKTEPSN